MITDNSLIALEIFHSMKVRNKSRKGIMSMKLDMSKAYDRVEWGFLTRLLLTMGFDGRWVNMVMRCVTTVSYSFIINGRVCGEVIPSRGLRQGDPLSPYLFILIADALSHMIKSRAESHIIHGARASRNGPEISHLLFADDSLLFSRATRQECLTVIEILNHYEKASGQKINFDKSEVSFSKGVNRERSMELINLLQMKLVQKHDKYLGVPTCHGSSMTQIFRGIVDRVWKKVRGWKEKLLPKAGKEVLIKSVVQAIPTYLMSIYKIPQKIIQEINSAMARFWWGGRGDARGIHWLSWEKLCQPKSMGGMGSKDLRVFNDALLGRQIWRLIFHHNSLLSRVMKAKYYPNTEVLDASLGYSHSYAWRSIWGAKSLVKEGVVHRIGNGSSTSIWRDPWVCDDKGHFIESEEIEDLQLVSDLINGDTKEWNMNIIDLHFNERDKRCILAIPLSFRGGQDELMWAHSKEGNYTVKSAYMIGKGCNLNEVHKAWVEVWKMRVTPKIRSFLWRACTNTLPVKLTLKRRHLTEEDRCPLCQKNEESQSHAIMMCEKIQGLWRRCGCEPMIQGCTRTNFLELILNWSRMEPTIVQKGCFLTWNIWFERSLFVFEKNAYLLTPLFTE